MNLLEIEAVPKAIEQARITMHHAREIYNAAVLGKAPAPLLKRLGKGIADADSILSEMETAARAGDVAGMEVLALDMPGLLDAVLEDCKEVARLFPQIDDVSM